MKTKSVIFVIAFLCQSAAATAVAPEHHTPLPTHRQSRNFTTIAAELGLFVQEHDVTTVDGYILKLFHIPGDRDRTVFLMHGILDSADTFILRDRGSLVYALASFGYDIWVGNFRGSTYSRRHRRLDADTDKSYWDFSFHEIGVYDLPPIIDHILLQNNVKQLSVVGHSLGNTVFYVLGSKRPEYNDRIKVIIALGPVCYLNVENFATPLSTVVEAVPLINKFLLAVGQEEVLGMKPLLSFFRKNVCAQKAIGYQICAIGILFQMAGEDADEFEPDFYFELIKHYPVATSRKNGLHLMQVAKKKEFAQFDYGPRKNLKLYNSISPPRYALGNVTMKVALLVGRNDRVTPLENVDQLRRQLPNVVHNHVMERPKFNHIDHVWGKNMDKYLFPHIMKLLAKYN